MSEVNITWFCKRCMESNEIVRYLLGENLIRVL